MSERAHRQTTRNDRLSYLYHSTVYSRRHLRQRYLPQTGHVTSLCIIAHHALPARSQMFNNLRCMTHTSPGSDDPFPIG